ncbi:MAG TPA: helix-turn-helix transcriptional regulator [Mucilaginibacter sp.]|nr:helix-turn-helix transcriptional regulator [Mucilaginibacter sp.]
MHTSQVIVTLRKKKNLSQTEFAKMIGLTQASLSNLESNKKKPHKSTISRICEVVEIPEQLFYLLALDEADLPDYAKERFNTIGKDLKDVILKSLESEIPV